MLEVRKKQAPVLSLLFREVLVCNKYSWYSVGKSQEASVPRTLGWTGPWILGSPIIDFAHNPIDLPGKGGCVRWPVLPCVYQPTSSTQTALHLTLTCCLVDGGPTRWLHITPSKDYNLILSSLSLDVFISDVQRQVPLLGYKCSYSLRCKRNLSTIFMLVVIHVSHRGEINSHFLSWGDLF